MGNEMRGKWIVLLGVFMFLAGSLTTALIAALVIEPPDLGFTELDPLYLPTMALGVLAIAGLTLTGLIAGRKKLWR